MINKYNNQESLLVISSYPAKDQEPAKLNAVACYTQNLFSSYKNRNIVVLSEKKGKTYQKGNVLVVPTWRPGGLFLFLQLIKSVVKFPKVKDVLVQFEFNMFGSIVLTSLLPFFIFLLKLFGKNVTLMQHQVVGDLSKLSGHLNFTKRSLKSLFFNKGIHGFYMLLGIVCDKIIVHEEYLKSVLARYVNPIKIAVISHGLSLTKRNTHLRKSVRSKLGYSENDFVFLSFGYIAWYKGVDFLIKSICQLSEEHPEYNLKLIIAGGASATLSSKKHYQRYLNKVDKLARKHKNVQVTGFVPESEVAGYFEACDLVVLPYRTMMSASGPLSYALKFNKPYICSSALKPNLLNIDSQIAMGTREVETFCLTYKSLSSQIIKLITYPANLKKLQEFSSRLRQLRTWDSIAKQYDLAIPAYEPRVSLKKIYTSFTKTFSSNFLISQENV